MESSAVANQQLFAPSSRLISDVFAPYSSLADEKKYEMIHRLLGKLLESTQECPDRVHISHQYTLLSFADYARLLGKIFLYFQLIFFSLSIYVKDLSGAS